MSNLQSLIAQHAALQQQIQTIRSTERTEAVSKVKALMAEYALSVADLGTGARLSLKALTGKSPKKVAAKYRDTSSGDSWSGRGLQPKWLKHHLATGKKIEDFAV